MVRTLTVRDASTTGETLRELELRFPAEQITVRELLRSRVHQQVKDHNARSAQGAAAGVRPTVEEAQLRTGAQQRMLSWQAEFERALQAFAQTRIILLVEGRQLLELDEVLELRSNTEVTFLQLVPLAGG